MKQYWPLVNNNWCDNSVLIHIIRPILCKDSFVFSLLSIKEIMCFPVFYQSLFQFSHVSRSSCPQFYRLITIKNAFDQGSKPFKSETKLMSSPCITSILPQFLMIKCTYIARFKLFNLWSTISLTIYRFCVIKMVPLDSHFKILCYDYDFIATNNITWDQSLVLKTVSD